MNALLFLLLSTALIWSQCLIGGTRLLFSFPSYIVLGSAAILSIFFIRRLVAKPSTAALVSTLLLAGYVIVRAIVSPIEYLSWRDLGIAGGCLLLYLLTALYFVKSQARLWLAILIMLAAIGQVWIAWIQHTGQADFMLFGFEGRPGSNPNFIRGTGMFISGNHLAGYLETTAMLALGIAVWSRWPWPARLLALAVTIACYSGVAISGSRGGYLSSAFSLVVFAFLTIRAFLKARATVSLGRRWIPVLCIITGVLTIGASAAYLGARNELVLKRFKQIGENDIRIYNWQAALDQFYTAPWFGTGAGTHLIYGRLFRRPQLQTDPVHAHGDYLEMIAEYGMVGGALTLLFLSIHLGKGFLDQGRIATFRLRNSGTIQSDSLALNIGAWSGLAALLAHSVVDFNMHIPANALLYAFLFGILANPGATRPEPQGWAAPSTLLRLLLPLMGGTMLLFTVPKLEGEKLAEQTRILLRDGNYPSVLKVAKQAITAEPQNPYPWFYLGEANRMMALKIPVPHLRERHFENAVHSYQNGLKYLPHDHSFLVRLGQCLDGLNRPNEAEAAYREALDWDPNLFVLYAYYGAHLKLAGKMEASKEAYKKASNLRETGKAEMEVLLEQRTRNQPEAGIDGAPVPMPGDQASPF